MDKTYTIALGEVLLYATVPDGSDLEAELEKEEDVAGIEIDRRELRVYDGLYLVHDTEDGDEVVYEGHSTGCLMNEFGEPFRYAVRRNRK